MLTYSAKLCAQHGIKPLLKPTLFCDLPEVEQRRIIKRMRRKPKTNHRAPTQQPPAGGA
jgi:hypothetical protein